MATQNGLHDDRRYRKTGQPYRDRRYTVVSTPLYLKTDTASETGCLPCLYKAFYRSGQEAWLVPQQGSLNVILLTFAITI